MEDEELYALNKPDRDALIPLLSSVGSDSASRSLANHVGLLWFKTSAVIPANGSGNAVWQEPSATGWTDTTTTYELYNRHPSESIAANKIVGALPSGGRFCVIVEMC